MWQGFGADFDDLPLGPLDFLELLEDVGILAQSGLDRLVNGEIPGDDVNGPSPLSSPENSGAEDAGRGQRRKEETIHLVWQ